MLKDINFLNIYYNGGVDVGNFYIDCLLNSTELKLCLGFFSTSGFRSLSTGFSYFIYNGGSIKFIINNILSKEDLETIDDGYNNNNFELLLEEEIIKNLRLLYETLSTKDKFFYNCISWLIHIKRIQIIIVCPKSGVGIAHNKFGIFSDLDTNKVAFTGSANFSKLALEYNLENLVAFTSWENEKENKTVNEFDNYFDTIWNKQNNSLYYLPVERIKSEIKAYFPVNNFEELLEQEKTFLETEINEKVNDSFLKKINYLKRKLCSLSNMENYKPSLPKNIILREYQLEAKSKWIENNYKGIFEMATGTGKTLTALDCALELFNQEKKIKLLILVPTITLILQWKEELDKFNFQNIVLAYSDNQHWYEQCLSNINRSAILDDFSFCILTTYKTFSSKNFQNIIDKLDSSSLIIADEAHNMGAKDFLSLFPDNISRRLGLSATPIRYFDETGTQKILEFFNALEGSTYKFDLKRAVENGFLCKYFYYPNIVKLTEEELDAYKEITKQLLKYFDKEEGKLIADENVTRLLIKRKRIIHKAQNKLNVFREILNELIINKNLMKYIFVYVPEGFSKDDEDRIINKFSKIIAFEYKLKQYQFIGGLKDKKEILENFEKGEIQVLTSMKCLDEGVDIRRAEIAIFCSSTGNPRQFIQRRGRILRTHPDKKYAKIYDMVVIPDYDYNMDNELEKVEKSIIKNELLRVYEFASIAENKFSSLKMLEPFIKRFGINIFQI